MNYALKRKKDGILAENTTSDFCFWFKYSGIELMHTMGASAADYDLALAPIMLRHIFTTEVNSGATIPSWGKFEPLEAQEENCIFGIKGGTPIVEFIGTFFSEEMLEHEIIVRMPPVKDYTARVRIKSIEKGIPHIVGAEEF